MPVGVERTRVLALGSGVTLLGVLRALSGFGLDVMALPDVDRVTRRSRFYKSAPQSLAGVTPQDFAERVSSLPAPTILIPCSDNWARAISVLSSEVRKRYPTSIPPLAAVETLVDKSKFRAVLERLELPHPTTQTLESIEDLDAVPDRVLESSFIKPADSQQFFARFGVKAFRTQGKADALRVLQQCMTGGFRMMLQEYIPGPPTNHYFIDGFVDRNGEVRALFARRRLRMSPPDFGNSTLQVSVPLAQAGSAVDTMRTLLSDLRYRGIFSAEFKKDARDGQFNLIEVNARPWWYVDFAARCGVNVCDLVVRDALGQPVPERTTYAVGRRCVYPYYDLQAVQAERAAGKLGIVGWALSWVGPYQPVFRWSDPLPATLEVAILLRDRVRKLASLRKRATGG